MRTTKSDRYLHLGALAASIVVAGLLNGYHFFSSVDINLHDMYISVFPWQAAVLMFNFFAFSFYLALSIRSRFRSLRAINILLIYNSVTIVVAIYFLFLAYAFVTGDNFSELFSNSEMKEVLAVQMNESSRFFVVTFLILILAEYLLIRRVKALRNG